MEADIQAYLYVGEGYAYNEVAGPVAATSESNGSRTRSLAEQFCHYEPWNGTRTNFKEAHEEKDGGHANVAHPGKLILQRKTQPSMLCSFL